MWVLLVPRPDNDDDNKNNDKMIGHDYINSDNDDDNR